MATQKKSDLSRAFSEDGARKTHVGGQALIEGIMMRGKFNWAVAVREPTGDIYLEEHDLASGRAKNSWLRLPIIRGCTAFVESLALGYRALEIAALHAFQDSPGTRSAADSSGLPREGGGALESGAISGTRRALEDRPGTPDSAVLANSGMADAADASSGTQGPCADHGAAQRPLGSAAGLGHSLDASSLTSDGPAGFGDGAESEFSWKRDFGNPDTMVDGLLAQRTLEVVTEPVEDDTRTDRRASSREAVEGGESAEPEFGHKEMVFSMVLGLVLGVVLFIVAPAFITNLIVGEYDQNTLAWNIVDGLLRVAVFVFYIWLIGRMSEIKRMFGYHGAEHKTIHCYEHGLDLTPENARSFPRLHVRCGTAFLIMVMIIAILVYTITPLNALIAAWGVADGAPKLVLVILVRIALMPLIAGIAYEITVKWAGSHPENPLVKVVLWPGMQMQRLTTREPDDGQIECAIAAMQQVLVREQAEEAAGNLVRAN